MKTGRISEGKPLTYAAALNDLRFWSGELATRHERLVEAERKLVEAALALDAVQSAALSKGTEAEPHG